jgi:hypothetical protein
MDGTMDLLSDDMLRTMLGWVPPGDVIQSVAHVSTRFARLTREESFWWNHPLVLEHVAVLPTKNPQQDLNKEEEDTDKKETRDLKRLGIRKYGSSSSRNRRQKPQQQQQKLQLLYRTFSTSQLQRFCLYAAAVQQKMDIPTCLEMGSVLVSKEQASHCWNMNGRRRVPPLHHDQVVCLASTTDHWNENLENVLPSSPGEEGCIQRQRIDNNNDAATAWWSSAPSPNPDSEDTLLFTLQGSTTMITGIQLKPLVDPFRLINTVYTWKKTILRAYYIPSIDGSLLSNDCCDDDDYVDNDSDGSDSDYSQEEVDNNKGATTSTEIVLVAHGCHTRRYNHEEDENDEGQDDQHHHHHHTKPSTAKSAVFYSFCRTGPGLSSPLRRMREPLWLAGGVAGALFYSPPSLLTSYQGTIDGVLANHVPVYESQPYDNTVLAESSQVLHYSIPLGVIANVIVITLSGKNHEQFEGSGYYACVEKVDCQGIEL